MVMTNESNQLSEREREILRLVAYGLSNQQIAYHLGISVNTVKVHLRNIFGKIGVASRTEATMYAVRSGIVTVERSDLAASPTLDIGESPIQPPLEAAPDGEFAFTSQSTVGTVSEAGNPAQVPAASTADATQRLASLPGEQQTKQRSKFTLAILAGLVLLSLVVGAWMLERQNSRIVIPTNIMQPTSDGDGAEADPRWKELPDARTPRAGFAIATLGERVYVVGGENETGVIGSVERYDARSETWTELSQKPIPVADVRAVVIGGKLYVPGGRRSSNPSDITRAFERYNPGTETWERLSDLPQPRSGYALATLEGKLYLFGGWDGSAYRQEVFEFDPERGSWRERVPMPTPRAFADAGVVEGSIYVLGGENETGQRASNEVYTPAEEDAQPWARRAPLPQPRSRFGTAVALSNLYVIGGESDEAAPVTYDVRTDNWQTLAAPPQATGSQPGVVLLDTTIMIIGGKLDSKIYSAEMQGYQALFTISLPAQQR
jgi:DNA-binding CsgD family transcriptional regulator